MSNQTGRKATKKPTTPVKPVKVRTALQEWAGSCGRGSYSDIAKGMGVCKSFVSRVLSGQRSPSLDTAEKISAALGLSLDEFAKMRRELVSQ